MKWKGILIGLGAVVAIIVMAIVGINSFTATAIGYYEKVNRSKVGY